MQVGRMLAEDMAKANGLANAQVIHQRGGVSLPPKVPSPVPFCRSVETERAIDMPRPCSTEEIPSWFEDLLNEPESPANRGHRRSASDPFAYLAASSGADGLWLRDIMGQPNWSFQMPHGPNYANGMSQASSARKSNLSHEKMPKTSSSSPPLPDSLNSVKEDPELKPFGASCSTSEPTRETLSAASEPQGQVDTASHTAESTSGGSVCSSQMKPAAPKPDVKRKQHNARRSRVRKLQYIAELERSAHALQLEGVEVSAQLLFFDQQNLILAMENRALKQRLDSLSQEHYIKSMEQELLDKELGRLQELYHLQNMNHHQQRQRLKQVAAHRRGRSCDIDSQFAKLYIHAPNTVATSHGFKDAQRACNKISGTESSVCYNVRHNTET